MMKNLLMSAAMGDIAGSAYEGPLAVRIEGLTQEG